MNKTDVINIMLEAFEKKNKQLAVMSGMTEEMVDKYIKDSKTSILFLLDGVLSELQEKNIIQNIDL
jgi:hypothetical protein